MIAVVNRNIPHMMRNPVQLIQFQKYIIAIDIDVVKGDFLEEQMSSAVMSSCLLTLHTIWNEYEFGFSDRNTAKD